LPVKSRIATLHQVRQAQRTKKPAVLRPAGSSIDDIGCSGLA
jgi:hypothetical protein